MPHVPVPVIGKLCFTGCFMKFNQRMFVSFIQCLAVAAYFPVYFFLGVFASFLYAALFVIGGIFSIKRVLTSHNEDLTLKYTVITLSTDLFAIIVLFANAYEIFGSVINNGNSIEGLWPHIYFSVVTFTTLGYGDYLPVANAQIIAVIQALVGYSYFALLVGVFGSMLYQRVSKT